LILVVALVLTLTTASSAGDIKWGLTARSTAMGNADLAVADDNEAWSQNPAGLARLSVRPRPGQNLGWVVGVTPTVFAEVMDEGWQGIYTAFGACDAERGLGFGGGWNRDEWAGWEATSFGAGFGMTCRRHPNLSWGVAVAHSSSDPGDSATTFDLGLLYVLPQSDGSRLKFGAKLTDLTDQADAMWGGRQVGLGIAYYTRRNWLFAVDWDGLGSDFGSELRAGVEFRNEDNGLAFSAGLLDGQTSYGGGYRWPSGRLGMDVARTLAHGNEMNMITVWGLF
jgi:hypothetical protein